ncbi:MAG TPA: cytochrome c [Kofleriaceae bacterium]
MRIAIALLVVLGCDNGESTPDWSRMITQPKLTPYGASELFADGRAMRPVPAGTIAREATIDTGMPVITRALIDRGRARYAVVCAPCHGVAGDGDSVVAHNMQRRRPPALFEPRVTELAPAAQYRVITEGYGLMPAYASVLSVADRWAVVAYVRTLALSWTARLDRLPPAVRDDATRRLP